MKKIIHLLLTILSFLNICLFYSMKPIWFFVNQEIDGNPMWSKLIFGILIIIFIINLFILLKVKVFKLRHLLMSIPIIIFIVLNIYLIYMLGAEKNIIFRNLIPLLPSFVIIVLLALLAQTKYKINTLTKCAIAIAIGFVIFVPKLNLQPIKITSGPNFSYSGDDLVVVWTTNVKGAGFVEIGTGDDVEVITASENGIIEGNTTYFKVVVSDIKDGDTFRVGSKKIKEYFQNNVVYGGTCYSDYLKYEDTRDNDEISFYVLSDIHERKDVYSKYLDGYDYDLIVFNGDVLSSVDNEKLIVSEFLSPVTNNTTKPLFFTRGNHETRGADVRILDDYLPMGDRYYYTFTYGSAFFIVLDTGEDKEDGHIEYGGLADFEAYRQEETAWLESVVESKEYEGYKYIIAISHIPLIEDEAFPYKQEWMELLSQMRVDVLLSGHTHKAKIIETESIPLIISGGYADANSGYEALKVSIGDSLKIDIVTENGEIRDSLIIQQRRED
ncbi:MAG: metallophosphoesterase [Eubacteriales bacterium]